MTDLRIFDPTKVRGLFEEKQMEIDKLRTETLELKKQISDMQTRIDHDKKNIPDPAKP